jgi:hypothetical protein
MLSEEVLRYLVIACHHFDNAKFAASPRHAIAESYSAIDSCFSALLIDAAQVPPQKISELAGEFAQVFGLSPK